MTLPIKRTARSRLETYASVSRTQTDEETYDHNNPDVAAVPDRPASDCHRLCGNGNRPVVPVDVGDRETDDMELTLLERFDHYIDDDFWFRGINVKPEEIRRALAIAQAVEEYDKMDCPIEHSGIGALNWIFGRATELAVKNGKN